MNGPFDRNGVGLEQRLRFEDDDLVFALPEDRGGHVKGVGGTNAPVPPQIEAVDPDRAPDTGEADEGLGDFVHFEFPLEEAAAMC